MLADNVGNGQPALHAPRGPLRKVNCLIRRLSIDCTRNKTRRFSKEIGGDWKMRELPRNTGRELERRTGSDIVLSGNVGRP
jgi:hypothetical protein